MARLDQLARAEAQKTGLLNTTVDRRNTRKLAVLVRRYGWPAPALVGKSAARAAWLLAQHADLDPLLQQSFLDAMRHSQRSTPDEITKRSIGLLRRRIAYMRLHYDWYSPRPPKGRSCMFR